VASGDIGLNVQNHELEQLADRLRKAGAGREAQRKYQRAVAAASRPIVPQVAAAARNARVTSSRGGQGKPKRSTRLRGRIADAVDARPTRSGIRIYIDANRVDEKYGESLPRYLDGELRPWRRWRHPVFGHEERWVQQQGTPWFFRTIRRHENRIKQAVLGAMDEVAREITR